mmetsp:Transcript_81870/g.228111  ORF Transcript_81870/g.228111 Transcript_81870/m.228111 type:complete len:521 (-) Transcript_81870:97-1659(-)
MGEFLQVRSLPQPRCVSELTPEAQGFKAFKLRQAQTESSRVVSLAFSPVAPHQLAVVSGTKVGIWQKGRDGKWEAGAAVSKFKDITQCVAWRGDGRLLLAGEASGSCAVVEAETRKVLRRFRGHGDAVTCASFAGSDRSRAATGAKDGKLRIWDITTSDQLLEVDAHADCMKVLSSGHGGPDTWISAGYDGKVKVWDLRIAEGGGTSVTDKDAQRCCVATMDHGNQVEDGVIFPGGTMYASAGGTSVNFWDLTAGGSRPVHAMSDAHSKAVTAVCLDSTASAILTASFDGLAKVFHAASFDHVWTYTLAAPATCAAWRPDDKAFVVGLDDGQWQLRERKTDAQVKAISKAMSAKKKFKRREGRLRGMDVMAASDDEVMDMHRPRKQKLSAVNYFLKKFEYRKAIEEIVLPSHSTRSGLAVVDEMLQRGALRAALTEVGEELCGDVLTWVHRAFGSGDALKEHLVFEMFHTLLDSNRCLQPPSSPQLHEVFEKIEKKVSAEVRVQEALFETSGMLETVMNL